MLWMALRKKAETRRKSDCSFPFPYQLNICSFVRFLIINFLYCNISYSAWKGLNSDSSPPATFLFPYSSAPRNRQCCMHVALRLDAVRGRLSVLSQKFGTVKIQGQSCQLTCSLGNLCEGQMLNNMKMWNQVILKSGPTYLQWQHQAPLPHVVCNFCFSHNCAVALRPLRAHKNKWRGQSLWMGGPNWAQL